MKFATQKVILDNGRVAKDLTVVLSPSWQLRTSRFAQRNPTEQSLFHRPWEIIRAKGCRAICGVELIVPSGKSVKKRQ